MRFTRRLSPAGGDEAIRLGLGVPLEAERVLVFGESSHWDPNWLLTSEEYYERRVRHVVDAAMEALERDPRRVFTLESVFFLKLYWERNPERREALRRLLDERRLRLSGTGMTTPDTVLPETEAIVRDYLLGQQWLREQGVGVEPRLAYIPDSFGCSPAMPSLLRSLGFDHAALTRIDGMYFPGADYRLPRDYPRPGSSAELLLRRERSLDFVWRGPDGAEVLTHWNAFTYFQGDMLAAVGAIRWMGRVFGLNRRSEAHVARRVARYVRQLEPVSRTPYLFCPIGCDFNDPIPELGELLDRYNRVRYPETGVWATCAGLDDYMGLVEGRRDELPTVELDPNPYWMGFYSSRPEVKARSNRVVHKLKVAERLTAESAAPEGGGPAWAADQARDLRAGWSAAVLCNHHDMITGTSPDRVYRAEQLPWLDRAEEHADRALARVRRNGSRRPAPAGRPEVRVGRDGRLEVRSRWLRAELAPEAGYAVVSLRGPDGGELLAGPANDLVLYRDTGGLWRMGHEFVGGELRAIDRASRRPAELEVETEAGTVEVRVRSRLGGRQMLRVLRFDDERPTVAMTLFGSASRGRTVTCTLPTPAVRTVTMDVPGAVVERPARKLVVPTFWPARSFALVRPEGAPRPLAVFLGGPASVTLGEAGRLEWVVLRNAGFERAFRLLPIACHPASGTNGHEDRFDYAFHVPGPDEPLVELAAAADRVLGEARLPDCPTAEGGLELEGPGVLLTAVKVASRGEGIVARLTRVGGAVPPAVLRWPGRTLGRAWLCDGRERDQSPLAVHGDSVAVPVEAALVSVRLVPA